jgi:hypothetical protein
MNTLNVTNNDVFSVSIDGNSNVSSLKEAIKRQQGYDPPSSSLALFDVSDLSITYSDAIVERLRSIDFDNKQFLQPLQRLSGMFSSLPDECLHIVVQVPSECKPDLFPAIETC